MIIGYARVSSTGQDHSSQTERLQAAGAEKVFQEKQSGLDRERPELARALEFAREGDVLIITKLDRLARSAAHLHEIVETLDKKGVGFKVLDDATLDTTTRTGKLVFGILASIAEFETALRKERQMEGIARAKAEGRTGGRPKTVDDDRIRAMREEGLSVPQIVKETGISRAAVYRALGS
ncbi:helix-turn-helix domain-containing protein [Sinorhizobium meliloti]|nr:helix-turn-helix domain-containing protein [Sinorhizobium meliloti]MDW9653264.1 helix-turn-helix domain-containing protein [Sinorhizobium meliloti]MDW9913228.1 helix-turn-helix domain-containing protein [Sinorhizobium meliloti]MDW9940066.1 helix-turn-helix domain-containing protein [Sinorhizobium meliloti]MDW9944330.1 helix-turn-helix domain-containing protein [Sinorhizobium meliloti]